MRSLTIHKGGGRRLAGGQCDGGRNVLVNGRGTAGDLGVILIIGSKKHAVDWDEEIDVVAVIHWHVDALGGGFLGALGGGFVGATVIVIVATIRRIKI
jgi:hypothetical protein